MVWISSTTDDYILDNARIALKATIQFTKGCLDPEMDDLAVALDRLQTLIHLHQKPKPRGWRHAWGLFDKRRDGRD